MKSKLSFCNIVLLQISLLILCSCETTVSTPETPAKEYYYSNINKVVEVFSFSDEDNQDCGTGWFLNETTVVTNCHIISYVFRDERIFYDSVSIRFSDETDYSPVKCIGFDDTLDIAFLNYSGNHPHSFFSSSSNIDIGEKCFFIGNNSNYGLAYREGYISLPQIKLEYNGQLGSFIQCCISAAQGDSGSALFNANNECLGMVAFRAKNGGVVEQGFAYCIPYSTIQNCFINALSEPHIRNDWNRV